MHPSPLVIWVNSPPHVERGAFEYLEDHWPDGVVYAVLGELRDERRAMGWEGSSDGSHVTIRARGSESVGEFCRDILADCPAAFHLVAGMSNVTGRALSRIARSTPPERVAIFSERPGIFGPLPQRVAKRLIHPLKYRLLVRRFRHRVGLILPLGQAGIERFVRYGWPRDKTAAFMYCPPMQCPPLALGQHSPPTRFLYVGRLSRYAKGTDLLIRASSFLRGSWRLTVVGGHGDLVGEVEDWSKGTSNVEFVGAVTPKNVSKLIAEHDVLVVPSRVDGWNVVVNEALYGGRGVIVTDAVGSDELIAESGAGIVIRAQSARRLAAAMQRVIDDPSLVMTWNERAVEYAPRISPDTVGRYLFEMLQAVPMQTPGPRPAPPWLRVRDKRETE